MITYTIQMFCDRCRQPGPAETNDKGMASHMTLYDVARKEGWTVTEPTKTGRGYVRFFYCPKCAKMQSFEEVKAE